jgi:hypothetical protein
MATKSAAAFAVPKSNLRAGPAKTAGRKANAVMRQGRGFGRISIGMM